MSFQKPFVMLDMQLGHKIWVILFTSLCCTTAMSQDVLPRHPEYGPNDTITVYATMLEDGTLVPTGVLPDAWCIGKMNAYHRKQMEKWTRLRKAVYVTYPYALQAGQTISVINSQLAGVKDKSERKRIIMSHEAALKTTFSDKVTNLSVYQGKVLMKLINRQTGNNCYEILKEYKGGANARFWQTVAFVFGSNLKQDYDAYGSDKEIEGYVNEIARYYPRS